ncbi:hypothetical protein SBA3_5040007 [Candidatus Sulfopaludibacter sp. SbA3]|nr:hypothetical protein SBA3_5040007 [Candidatus Sulfopaludibacter sp. SbA3]
MGDAEVAGARRDRCGCAGGEARGLLRKNDAALREALSGKLDPVYRLLLQQNLAAVELLRRQIEQIQQALSQAKQACLPTLVRLSRIPRWTGLRRKNCWQRSVPVRPRFLVRSSWLRGWGSVQAPNPKALTRKFRRLV